MFGKKIKQEFLPEAGVVVSTVELPGMLQASGGSVETMVFRADSKGEIIDWLELDFARCGKANALKQHEEMVERAMRRAATQNTVVKNEK